MQLRERMPPFGFFATLRMTERKQSCLGRDCGRHKKKKDEAPQELRPSKNRFVET